MATSGRYYKFYDLVKSRDDASGICSADNTTLVSIESISHWAQIWSHIDSKTVHVTKQSWLLTVTGFYTGSLWGFWLPVKKGPGPHLHCTNTNCNSINYNLLLDDGGTLDWNTTWPMNLTTNGVTEDCFFGIRTEIKDISCGARSDVKILCEFSCKQGRSKFCKYLIFTLCINYFQTVLLRQHCKMQTFRKLPGVISGKKKGSTLTGAILSNTTKPWLSQNCYWAKAFTNIVLRSNVGFYVFL